MTLHEFFEEWNDSSPSLLVHTSGSTGTPKPMRVEKSRMMASARLTCHFLGLNENDSALLCMPLDYIAGKMVVVRSIVSGMRLISVVPSSHPLRGLKEQPSFAAMVPMQVYSTLQNADEALMLAKVKNLIIGGGAIDHELERKLKDFPNAVWSTYGMTETLSHIALRRLNGAEASRYYMPFDNVEISQSSDGSLCIKAPAVCPVELHTNDIVEFHPDGRRFVVIGRKDNVIDTGGIKVHAEEVEERIRPFLTRDFAISKKSDTKFGEIIVLLVSFPEIFSRRSETGNTSMLNLQSLDVDKYSAVYEEICKIREEYAKILPRYWQPREIYLTASIPHTGTGKIARGRILSVLSEVSD